MIKLNPCNQQKFAYPTCRIVDFNHKNYLHYLSNVTVRLHRPEKTWSPWYPISV